MSVISEICCAVPPHRITREMLSKVGAHWLSDNPDQRALFDRLLSSCGVSSRHFFCDPKELTSHMDLPTRARLFETFGKELLNETLRPLQAQGTPTTLITTSCSVPVIPSLDVSVIRELDLPASIRRIPLYQHGCVGGVSGLSLAHQLMKAKEEIWVASVELCSLVFHMEDQRGVSILAASLFGDGSASARVLPQGPGLQIEATQSYLIPSTEECMGYDIFDTGSHLRLHPELPQVLAQHVPKLLHQFLETHTLCSSDIKWWLFHPGGVKILQFLENAFEIQRDQCRWSWEVLNTYGNMSSATILFVAEAFMRDKQYKDNDLGVIVGVGPGLTIELVLFRCVS